MTLTDHERRILSYLDQHGQTRRDKLVFDLASPDSKIGWCRDNKRPLRGSGSSNGEAMIAANWCKRLLDKKLLREETSPIYGTHFGFVITNAGKMAMRPAPSDGRDGGKT